MAKPANFSGRGRFFVGGAVLALQSQQVVEPGLAIGIGTGGVDEGLAADNAASPAWGLDFWVPGSPIFLYKARFKWIISLFGLVLNGNQPEKPPFCCVLGAFGPLESIILVLAPKAKVVSPEHLRRAF